MCIRDSLLVVGEVRRDDALQLHPQVAVVVLDHVAAGSGAGDDLAAALGDEHRGAHRRTARVLEHDVGAVSYTHLRAHETVLDLVCRLLLEKKKITTTNV